MASFKIHLTFEITDDGRLQIDRGGWTIIRDAAAKGAVTPDEIRRVVDSLNSMPQLQAASAEPPSGEETVFTNLPMLDALSAEPPAAVKGKFLERQQVAVAGYAQPDDLPSKIAAAGWMTREDAAKLVALHGVSRVRDVSNWIGKKIQLGNRIHNPGALLASTCGKKSPQDAR